MSTHRPDSIKKHKPKFILQKRTAQNPDTCNAGYMKILKLLDMTCLRLDIIKRLHSGNQLLGGLSTLCQSMENLPTSEGCYKVKSTSTWDRYRQEER